MLVEPFVRWLWESSQVFTQKYEDLNQAGNDLDMLRINGYDVPAGLTASDFLAQWNELCDEHERTHRDCEEEDLYKIGRVDDSFDVLYNQRTRIIVTRFDDGHVEVPEFSAPDLKQAILNTTHAYAPPYWNLDLTIGAINLIS